MKSQWDLHERRLFWLCMVIALVMLLSMIGRLFH